ncbi:hypothetical protein QWZ06_01580 [Chryseobacterium tructae]|uniref:Uncharacterized protein n=1 Tax=Chryseobacterium tructae TaxID=1037380 RepID=A0ABV7XU66_9FLAO|nr:hypothetical protein [Chryseobacterium tructae]MDN3691050.1 hypothetical protein [Chryseobacterium tructae]
MVTETIENGKINGQIRRRIVDKYGEEYLNKPISEMTLQELAEVFPEMYNKSAKDYSFANSGNIYDTLELEYGVLYHDGREVNGITDSFSGKVLLSPAFLRGKNVISVAATWYHETIHSIHAVSGLFMNTVKLFMTNGNDYNTSVRKAIDVSETIAHLQTQNFGLDIPFRTPNNLIRKYSISYIEFLNLK